MGFGLSYFFLRCVINFAIQISEVGKYWFLVLERKILFNDYILVFKDKSYIQVEIYVNTLQSTTIDLP